MYHQRLTCLEHYLSHQGQPFARCIHAFRAIYLTTSGLLVSRRGIQVLALQPFGLCFIASDITAERYGRTCQLAPHIRLFAEFDRLGTYLSFHIKQVIHPQTGRINRFALCISGQSRYCMTLLDEPTAL